MSIARWARGNSLWVFPVQLGCCSLEWVSATTARFDMMRLGVEIVPEPELADCLWVMGTVTAKVAPHLKAVYERMREPKWVVAVGACATNEGVFHTDLVVRLDSVLPVDVYISGCPPKPEAMIDGLLLLKERCV